MAANAELCTPNSETIARRYWEARGRLSSLIHVPIRSDVPG
jgi:hypothetical protein